MTKYREILRMQSAGYSQRKIAAVLELSRNTVANVIRLAQERGISWDAIVQQELSEDHITAKLFPDKKETNTYKQPDCAYISKELRKTGVTLQMLWTEYVNACNANNEQHYMYSRYCDIYRQSVQKNKATMRIPRTPGLQVEVDWAGKCGYLKDPTTGEQKPAYIFVAAMSYSQYSYVEAFLNMSLGSWIQAHINLFEFLGGVPKSTVPDNLKVGITTPFLAEPVIQKNYQEFAEHYNTFIVPARVRKPRDKALAESSVNNLANNFLGKFRNQTYFTIADFNTDLHDHMFLHNSHEFQKKAGSRATLFAEEKDLLSPLPKTRYELAFWKTVKVQPNYHISAESMFYSVPFQYISKQLEVKLLTRTVEIYDQDKRICSHVRLYGRAGQYSTVKEHMPEKHQRYLEWDDDRFIRWARTFGPATEEVIKSILQRYPVSQQAYRSCMGVLKMAKETEKEKLENACITALKATSSPSYQVIKRIFSSLPDKTEAKTPSTDDQHAFIRNL